MTNEVGAVVVVTTLLFTTGELLLPRTELAWLLPDVFLDIDG